jgi:hypothetical protein
MAKWMSFLLAGGVSASGQRLVNLTTLATMVTPQFTVGTPAHQNILRPYFPGSSNMPDYGFTWFLGWENGYDWISHGVFAFLFTAYAVRVCVRRILILSKGCVFNHCIASCPENACVRLFMFEFVFKVCVVFACAHVYVICFQMLTTLL